MTPLYLSPPHLSGHEQRHLAEALASNWVAPAGPALRDFEGRIEAFTEAPHAVALNAGTAAIHLALRLLDVGPGDEVLCPSFNFVGCLNPVRYLGATPVLVDSEPDTWNVCPDALARALADRQQRPKALVVVHLYGQAAHLEPILALAERYGVPVVEDAAEAFGATYRGRAVGTFGRLGIYSFNGNKIITTSGGGALVTAEPALAARALFLATQAREAVPHYEHREVGYNYRLSNVAAALGCGQMEVVRQRIAQRRAVFERYRTLLADLPLTFSPELPDGVGTRWLTCVLLNRQVPVGPAAVCAALNAAGIEARRLWQPMHRQPLYAEAPYYATGDVCGDLFDRGLCLPSGSALTLADQQRVTDALGQALSPA